MTDGSKCPNGGDLTASTAIRFICDPGARRGTQRYTSQERNIDLWRSTGGPKVIATLPPDEETACTFFVEWRTEVWAQELEH